MGSPAQLLLKAAGSELAEHAPGGIEIDGSGGKGVPTHSPWIAFFDPDETTTPQAGVCVVYLLAADLRALVLSLQQGITKLTGELGAAAARARLTADAVVIRTELGATALSELSLPSTWELRDSDSEGTRPVTSPPCGTRPRTCRRRRGFVPTSPGCWRSTKTRLRPSGACCSPRRG